MENTLQYYLIEADRYRNLLEKCQKYSLNEKSENVNDNESINIDRLTEIPPKGDSVSENDNNNEDFFILRCFPKNCVNKCKIILHHIRNNSSIQWNSLGNVIIDQQVIDKSNIIDCLRFLLLPAKEQPSGWDHFAYALAKCNFPVSLVSNGIAKADINLHSSSIISDHKQTGEGNSQQISSSDTVSAKLNESGPEKYQHVTQFDTGFVPPPPGYEVEQFEQLQKEKEENEQLTDSKEFQKGQGKIKKKSNPRKRKKENNVKVIDIKGIKWLTL